jgi:hypothetical protein
VSRNVITANQRHHQVRAKIGKGMGTPVVGRGESIVLDIPLRLSCPLRNKARRSRSAWSKKRSCTCRLMSLSMFDSARQVLTAALAENEFDPVAHFLMGRSWPVDKEWLQARNGNSGLPLPFSRWFRPLDELASPLPTSYRRPPAEESPSSFIGSECWARDAPECVTSVALGEPPGHYSSPPKPRTPGLWLSVS